MCLGVSIFCPIVGTWMQVMYETSGFLEKNRDLLHADLLQLLASCDSFLPQLFAASIGEGSQKVPTPTRRVNGTESQKQSVAAKFKVFCSYNFSVHCLSCFLPKDQSGRVQEYCWWVHWFCCAVHQASSPCSFSSHLKKLTRTYCTEWLGVQGQLNKLMQRLGSTEPHFIRCIKPNTHQLPNVVDQELVLQQLRCCGVLEVVRIARSGYPTRHSHDQFATRWTTFCPCGEGVWENIMHVAASLPAMPQHPQVKLVMQGNVYQEISEQRILYHWLF